MRFVLKHIYCACAYPLNNLICLYMYMPDFFKDIFKYPLIIKVPFYFAIISWHALVFCSLSRHWYLRSQSLTSWMIHTPKVKCSKDPDCHRRCGIFTKIIFTCWKNFQDTGCTSDMYTYLMYNICKKRPFTIWKYVK